MTQLSKTAFIVPYKFAPPSSGGQNVAFGFAEFYSRKHTLVCISTTNNQDTPAFELEKLFQDTKSKYFSPKVMWRLFQFFKKNNIKRCIIFQPFMLPLLFPILVLLRMELTIYVQNIEFERFKSIGKWWWRLMFLLEKIAYRFSDNLFFVTPLEINPAIQKFGLNPQKCKLVLAGTYQKSNPVDIESAQVQIRQSHGYKKDEFLILFYGSRSYAPNAAAVKAIIEKINPILKKETTFNYRILICGGGPIPENIDDGKIDLLGFVENIEDYIKAADIVLNPVIMGAGIQTKIIEAIGLGKTVISSVNAARGVDTQTCGNKLLIVENDDSEAFCTAIIAQQKKKSIPTPDAFYEMYYWGNTVGGLEKI